jgi:hypothetical protein
MVVARLFQLGDYISELLMIPIFTGCVNNSKSAFALLPMFENRNAVAAHLTKKLFSHNFPKTLPF